uniref:CSON008991 protein n=1 Tax=Culicoides sonorensis TaxID=179676 RepID=A0A336MZC6_CULSO
MMPSSIGRASTNVSLFLGSDFSGDNSLLAPVISTDFSSTGVLGLLDDVTPLSGTGGNGSDLPELDWCSSICKNVSRKDNTIGLLWKRLVF